MLPIWDTERVLMKLATPLLACLLAFAAAGCQNDRPDPYTPEHALDVYRGRLAVTCPEKHRETLSAEQFGKFGREYYIDADTQTQQLIDLDSRKSCGLKGSTQSMDKRAGQLSGECYEAGFIQASIQIGNLDEVAKSVCAFHAE